MGIFKAYDIRGKVPADLDADTAYRIGCAAVAVLGSEPFVIGRDMRISGEEIADALMRGITDAGADVTDMGLATTPMNYFAVGHGGFGAGAMVTASHNPPEWNGFKFSRAEAAPVSYDTGYGEMEKLVTGDLPPRAGKPGRRKSADLFPEYRKHILSFAEGVKPLKVAIDAGNGMAGRFLPSIFEELPCDLTPLYFELDGTFPNHEANPLKAENVADLQRKVVEVGADVGMAYDGDADRCMFIDEKGARVSSDLITALLAQEMLPPLVEREPGPCVIYDLRSSRVVPEEIEKAGGRPLRSRVGHSFMKRLLRDHNCPFGGELSGHYYFRDHYYSDCADLAMVYVLRLLSKTGKTMSELIAPLQRYYATGEVNFDLTSNAEKDAKLRALEERFTGGEVSRLDGLTVRYADWWFNVRPSNTEPVLRLNLEAGTPALRDAKRAEVESVLRD